MFNYYKNSYNSDKQELIAISLLKRILIEVLPLSVLCNDDTAFGHHSTTVQWGQYHREKYDKL